MINGGGRIEQETPHYNFDQEMNIPTIILCIGGRRRNATLTIYKTIILKNFWCYVRNAKSVAWKKAVPDITHLLMIGRRRQQGGEDYDDAHGVSEVRAKLDGDCTRNRLPKKDQEFPCSCYFMVKLSPSVRWRFLLAVLSTLLITLFRGKKRRAFSSN